MPESAPGNGQGAQESPASSSAAVSTPPAAQPAAAIPWLEGADPVLTGYVQNKGWEKPIQVLESYQNLEKLLGADRAGNTVVLPKPDAPQAELDAFYNRLGRPADPTGYKFEVPQGGDPEFAKAAAGKMHELGIPQKAGEALASWWNEQVAGATSKVSEAALQMNQAQQEALKTAWGSAYKQNEQIAATAARGLGLDQASLDALDKALGFDKTMQLLHTIGSKIGEPTFEGGSGPAGFGTALTPGQAQARIAELKQDKNWVTRLMNKDAAASAEWSQLHAYAYPEEARG